MEVNYVHKDGTTLVQDKLVKTEVNQIELQYNANALKQQKFNELLKENQELKKQLEDMTLCRDIASGHREEVQDREVILLNQQKEFINYLENEINKLKEQIKNYDIWHEVGTDINFLILKKQFYLEILQKYKEIIGVLDDKKRI